MMSAQTIYKLSDYQNASKMPSKVESWRVLLYT